MVLYPAAQQKAQQEIDTVVGQGRLPTFADRASLPFGPYSQKYTNPEGIYLQSSNSWILIQGDPALGCTCTFEYANWKSVFSSMN